MSQSPTRALPTLSIDAAKIAAQAAEAKAKQMGIGTHLISPILYHHNILTSTLEQTSTSPS